jgi:hypothetical protein
MKRRNFCPIHFISNTPNLLPFLACNWTPIMNTNVHWYCIIVLIMNVTYPSTRNVVSIQYKPLSITRCVNTYYTFKSNIMIFSPPCFANLIILLLKIILLKKM